MKGFILSLLSFLGIASTGEPIKEGQPAYRFALYSDEGKIEKLENYMGRWVVLYFYPKADTPGCTVQAKEYTKLMPAFEKANIKVFGISTDSVEAIRKFKEKYQLKVTFLSDPKGQVARAYGVTVIAGFCSRDTVIVNPQGMVEKIYRGVDPASDPHQVLQYITSKKS